ncbi:cytochrome bd-I oxidase subunit CydX [Methylobacter luteus]|jgi:cyd operon protein YbgT|nr:cytochrome bd-I oxidase subunit CydX [Methylobacter luteus]
MWYFTWMLGASFAAAFAVINAMWLESNCDIDNEGIEPSCDAVQKGDS